jgi:hypothetical protein
MFKGKAHLTNGHKTIGKVVESCRSESEAHITVTLDPPIELEGTATLGLYFAGSSEPVLSTGTRSHANRHVSEFSGKSTLGCLLAGANISLTKSPGGKLS